MKHLVKYDDLLNEGFGFGKGFIKKAMELIEKLKDLFKDVVLSDSEIREIFDNSRLNFAVLKNHRYYNQIKDICNANEERVTKAYNEVFGIKEGFLLCILLSVAVCFFIYYAIQKGWADKIIRKFDPNFRGQGGYPGDNWARASKSKNRGMFKKEEPKKIYKSKQQQVDEVLDKVARVGYKRLSPAEKEILKNK
jgi:hypothetical protein